MSTKTISQKTITLDLEGAKKIVVHRMRWKMSVAFLNKLAVYIGEIGTKDSLSQIFTALPELIKNSEELIEHLVINSTEFSADEFGELDLLQASEVINAALEVNVGDELKNCWTAIVTRLGTLVAAKVKTKFSGNSTPTSSTPDSTAPTSTPAPSSTSISS